MRALAQEQTLHYLAYLYRRCNYVSVELGNGVVRFKAEVNFLDGCELTRKYLINR